MNSIAPESPPAQLLAHGIGDIKDTTDGDVRFSRAFGMELLQT